VTRVDGSIYMESANVVERTGLKIAVGSGSAIKKAAAETIFPEFTVVTFGASSCVSEQPVGDEETERGAYNRAKATTEQFPNAVAWIGIENGMMNTNNKWVDKAAVVCIFNKNLVTEIMNALKSTLIRRYH